MFITQCKAYEEDGNMSKVTTPKMTNVFDVFIPMVASNSFINICQTNSLIGIHRRNFKRRMDRWLGFVSHMDRALWALCDRAKKKDALSLEVTMWLSSF